MKLLMITPTADPFHPVHGSAYTWITRIAGQVDRLHVISLNQKNVEPDSRVKFYSLGTRRGRLSKYLYLNSLLLKLVPQVDLIFTHMYPIFPILVWPYAFIFRKPLVAWRCHNGHISLLTRLGHFLVDRVVTASEESYRIRSPKVKVIGHGVDMERFTPRAGSSPGKGPALVSVGRISPVKDYETLVEATNILINEYGLEGTQLVVVGGQASESEKNYFEKVKALVQERGLAEHVQLVGSVPFNGIVDYYHGAELFVSASQTGSIDKAVLEAMACGNLPVVCNEAFFPFLGSYCPVLTFIKSDSPELAKKIYNLYLMPDNDKTRLRSFLRQMVEGEHSLDTWLPRLISVFQEVTGRR